MQATATRTDAHRPAEFDPADYQVIDYLDNRRPEPPRTSGRESMEAYQRYVKLWEERIFEHFPDWQTGGGDHRSIFQCNHCGHPGIRWIAVVLHAPTGSKLAFGETCAERCDIDGRDAFRSKFIKDRAALEQAAYENKQRKAAFAEANSDVAEFLASIETGDDADWGDFLVSIARQLERKGELSERQVAAVRENMKRQQERDERIAVEKAALVDAPVLAEGRYEIEGEVVSVKSGENDYGYWIKMLVRMDDGNKVYGTLPRSIEEDADLANQAEGYNALRGQRVKLTAKVERSQDDEHFGFFSRPTKAEVQS